MSRIELLEEIYSNTARNQEPVIDKIVTREEIMNYLWESENFIDDNTLTVNMTRLRGKLEELGIKDSIETKRGQGYILK